MIKAIASSKNNRKILMLGLEQENWNRLIEGSPIHFNGEEIGLSKIDVIIIGGETSESIQEMIGPYIKPETIIERQKLVT